MKRNKFSLSHTKLLSGVMGDLIPISLVEVLPGDTMQQQTSCLVRLAPLLAPVMHPVHCHISHWFVPHRLVWEDWENFITGGPDGTDASVFPTITAPAGGNGIGTLEDYLGVPTDVGNLEYSALPIRGYQLIWNEWFRDQDLQTEQTIDLTSGPDTTTHTDTGYVNWEKDYFTTSRPWEQKGPAMSVPVPVDGLDEDITVSNTGDSTARIVSTATSNNMYVSTNPSSIGFARWENTALEGSVSINLLREAFALQRFEEARARFGSRYVEYLRYLGVRSSDARLQRPEFLGGGRYPVQFSEVLQTAEGTDPVGELRGHGIGVSKSNRYRRFFEEHGYIFTLMYVRPKAIYMDGLPRTWNRRTKEDFFQKELVNIGQMEVLNKEVYAAHATPDGVFGYQDRYDEYRRQDSTVSGDFRTNLNFWHFARAFSSDPALNSSFVECIPTENPFAVPSQDVLYVMARHSIQARRLLPKMAANYVY